MLAWIKIRVKYSSVNTFQNITEEFFMTCNNYLDVQLIMRPCRKSHKSVIESLSSAKIPNENFANLLLFYRPSTTEVSLDIPVCSLVLYLLSSRLHLDSLFQKTHSVITNYSHDIVEKSNVCMSLYVYIMARVLNHPLSLLSC